MSGTTCPRRTLFHAIVVSLLSHVLSKNLNTTESCAELYEKGVDAYLDNDFERCVSNFEAALALYRSYTKKLQICRLRCAEEAELSEPLYHVDIENLRFYEKAIRNTLCIIKCKEKSEIFGAYNIDKETESLFENRKPYEYLHICYFQVSADTNNCLLFKLTQFSAPIDLYIVLIFLVIIPTWREMQT